VAAVFCNHCGHQNPSGARFCSNCGAPLDAAILDRTITIPAVDPGLESSLPDDDIVVDRSDIPDGGALLVVRSAPAAGTIVFVKQGARLHLGRHPEAEVFLDDITVSRRHVLIEARGERFIARDEGSLNGTYVNRQRIDEQALADGDELQVGKFKLVFLTNLR
jgi:hypothetical protein